MRAAPTCGRRLPGGQQCHEIVELGTDELGRVTSTCPKCDRTRRGLCHDCAARVWGRALRCADCARRRRREADRRRMADPGYRRQRNARNRVTARTPQRVASKRAARRAWRQRNPDRVRAHKRRYLLKQTPAYLAYQRQYNTNPDRQAKKRAWALRRYYEQHPVRPDPRCTSCGAPIAWTPRHGRPRRTCDQCCAPAERRRRARRDNRRRREVAA